MSGVEEDEETTDLPADEAGLAHARTNLAVEERIDHIVGMMERFEWVRGKSAKVLAAEWGLAVATVEKHSAEASRRCTADADEVRRDITLGGRKLLISAIDSDNHAGFKQVADVLAAVSGAKAPERHELSGAFGVADVTPATAAELVRKKFGGHAAKRDSGEASPDTGDVPGSTPGA